MSAAPEDIAGDVVWRGELNLRHGRTDLPWLPYRHLRPSSECEPQGKSQKPENQFDTIMAVKGEVFPEAPYPNWTAIGVNWLAGFDFEIRSSPVSSAEDRRAKRQL